MGTHPLAPSTLDDGAPLQSIAGELPYLLKFMAAAIPLSLQTHPDAGRARAGFDREESLGIPRDAAHRTYRDPFAKPEMLCAITSFDTLCGFRPLDDTLALLHDIGAADLVGLVQHGPLSETVAALYHGKFDTASTIAACRRQHGREAALVAELDDLYPGDPSVVVTLLLNRVMLAAGEAVFLGPGNMHAYVRGFGVEVMANSDNVVRGGLTVKHVDVDELLDVLDFEPLADPVVRPVEIEPGHWRYDTPRTPFAMSRLDIDDGRVDHHVAAGRQLVLWVSGTRHGECVFLAPGEHLDVHGPATVFVVDET